MNLKNIFVRTLANADQKLAVFKEYFDTLDEQQQAKALKYVEVVASLSPNNIEQKMEFWQSIGCTGNKIFSAEFTCDFFSEGETTLSSRIDPNLLFAAMSAWHKGEEFLPAELD
ncbi:hypothetical protein BH11PLA2_BH11PLA2_49750 [soil metagenome]